MRSVIAAAAGIAILGACGPIEAKPSVGEKAATAEAGAPLALGASLGRFQVINTANSLPILLDTASGDSWLLCNRYKPGDDEPRWCPLPRVPPAEEMERLVKKYGSKPKVDSQPAPGSNGPWKSK